MKRHITTTKENAPVLIKKISEQQTRNKCFYNVTVKPYTGKKYDNQNTVTITIG